MSDASLTSKFEQAQEDVRNLAKRPSDEALLELYALFKQATEGDVTSSRPSFFDFRACAKHDAREKVKGLDKEAAMERYCQVVVGLQGNG